MGQRTTKVSTIILILIIFLFPGTDIFASSSNTSTIETVPLDIVRVIDISESMAYDAATGDPMRDPGQCNPAHG